LNTNEAKPLNSVSGDPKHRRPMGEPSAPTLGVRGENSNGGRVATSYASARAAREVVELQIRRFELKRLEGAYVDVEEVRTACFNVATRIRVGMEGIPDRVSPLLVGMTDQFEIRRILSTEIKQVLTELSRPLDFSKGKAEVEPA
jgi:hypothetical protein